FTAARRKALEGADTILAIGTRMDFRLNHGQPPLIPSQANIIWFDLAGEDVGINRGAAVGLVGDVGLSMHLLTTASKQLNAGDWLDPGPMGCLGTGTGFAMAAQIARPGKKVLILHGDGAFGLNGMEFESMVRQQLPIVSIIGNDGAWGQIKHPQKAILGHATAAELSPGIRYDRMVEALGGYGELVQKP